MEKSLQDLKAKIDGYNPEAGINWSIIKEILSSVSALLKAVAANLPVNLLWLGSLFSIVASVLDSLINSLPSS